MTEQWIKDLEHDTNEDLEIPFKVKDQNVEEKSLEQLQREYMNPNNPALWDGQIDEEDW